MRFRPAVVLVVACLRLALVPMAYASPPDETWIAGLYDAGDYDDAVILITSTPSTSTSAAEDRIGPHQAVTILDVLSQDATLPASAVPSPATRAPPAA